MVQTEWLSPDAARWEISPVFAPSNTAMQTVRRPRKNKEKALKPSGFKAFPMAGAEWLEVASQPLLRCPKKSSGCRFSSIFSTAAPTPARCIRHRRRSQALPGTPHFAREGACAADGIHRREDAVNIRRPFHGQRIFGAPRLSDRSARTKKVPIHLWVYRYFFGRGRRARTLGTRFWSGCREKKNHQYSALSRRLPQAKIVLDAVLMLLIFHCEKVKVCTGVNKETIYDQSTNSHQCLTCCSESRLCQMSFYLSELHVPFLPC